MPAAFHPFLADDSGAVTIDWMVLTAIAAGFGVMVLIMLSTGTTDLAARMETTLSSVEVQAVGDLSDPS